MITLNLDFQEGQTFPDGIVDGITKSVVDEYNVSSEDCTVSIGSEIQLDYFRKAIISGKISHTSIQILYKGELYSFDKYAKYDYKAIKESGIGVGFVACILKHASRLRKESRDERDINTVGNIPT